jgi:hypothetical protein
MWNLIHMTIFINHQLYVGYSSSQYGTGVLQYNTRKIIITHIYIYILGNLLLMIFSKNHHFH